MPNNPLINITIPIYNEGKILESNVLKLYEFLSRNISCPFEITLVDNGSTDNSAAIAGKLSGMIKVIRFLQIKQKGKGLAIKRSWLESSADILSFMDADLSTNLRHFPELIDTLIAEGNDIAIGSRLIKGNIVKRSIKRDFVSRTYNILLKLFFLNRFSDAQCGFKAIRKEAAKRLIPMTRDDAWFFDSELLIIAEKLGYKIKEIPIEWTENVSSDVDILKVGCSLLKGILRLRFDLSRIVKGDPSHAKSN